MTDTFDKFLKLPQELQDYVWHYFCPDLNRPRMFPMILCCRKCEHKTEDGYACVETAGLRDVFPSLERNTQCFRIYSAVSRATRAQALAYAPDILEFCGCPRKLTRRELREQARGLREKEDRSDGFIRYNASRDLIYIMKAEGTVKEHGITTPYDPHIRICNGKKRTFQEGRLGPRHVAIERLEEANVSPDKLAEALSYMFPGCHTFYYEWRPHHVDEDNWAPLKFTFESGHLEEVAWLADNGVTRISNTMPEHWDENGIRFSFSWCWVNAEHYPRFADSLPYRRFASAEELEDEMMLTEELRKRSFNTSYVMTLCDYDADDEDHDLGPATFNMIVKRVKGLSDTAAAP
jgi:hypothetical protein